jgi:prepilin-type N-terminal cleavage/methylation domain-containing protein
MHQSGRRKAFTLIELLVVIAIIAILVALLLPAVQQVREAARKSQCQDHLHNLGIALHSYEGSHKVMPPGQIRGLIGANEWGSGFSWGAMILPYIEQKPLYDQLDFQIGSFMGNNKTNIAANSGIDIALCPSDASRPAKRPGPHATGTPNWIASVPSTSYFGSAGSFSHWGDSTQPRLANGVFVYDPAAPVTMAGISDGTSNTIAIGEKNYNVWTGGSFLGMQHNTNTPGTGDSACCQDWYLGIGIFAPNVGATTTLTTPTNPDNQGFSGPHAGGVQFVFMDGKVGFISENVDHTRSSQGTWATIGGGCMWANGECDYSSTSTPMLAYDDKNYMGPKFGVYQRLHARNDGLPVRPGT